MFSPEGVNRGNMKLVNSWLGRQYFKFQSYSPICLLLFAIYIHEIASCVLSTFYSCIQWEADSAVCFLSLTPNWSQAFQQKVMREKWFYCKHYAKYRACTISWMFKANKLSQKKLILELIDLSGSLPWSMTSHSASHLAFSCYHWKYFQSGNCWKYRLYTILSEASHCPLYSYKSYKHSTYWGNCWVTLFFSKPNQGNSKLLHAKACSNL